MLLKHFSIGGRERLAVIKLGLGSFGAHLFLIVIESTQSSTRASLWAVHVAARLGLEESRMIELLLGAMREWTSLTIWATFVVSNCRVLLIPIRAGAWAVANRRVTPDIKMVMGINAILPIMLNTNRAPEHLVPFHVEIGSAVLSSTLFFCGQQITFELLTGVSKGTLLTTLAHSGIWIVCAEAALELSIRVERAWTVSTGVFLYGDVLRSSEPVAERLCPSWHARRVPSCAP